jgi:hypothetical protein
VREDAALGHLHAFGQGADGQALQADARRQLECGRHDRGSGEFAFFHDPVCFSTTVLFWGDRLLSNTDSR